MQWIRLRGRPDEHSAILALSVAVDWYLRKCGKTILTQPIRMLGRPYEHSIISTSPL